MADYMYGSARVRTLEASLIGRERIESLLDAKSTAEMWSRLQEYGVEPVRDAGGFILREETLLEILRRSYREILEIFPDDAMLELWRYPYDCNNLKAAIKAFERKIDPRSMMFDFGVFDAEHVIRMVETRNFEALPRAMRMAAEEGISAYAKTKNPQQIDLLLDRACFADMLCAAQKSGNEFAIRLVRRQIDLTNLLICVRILRMQSGEAGKLLLCDAWIDGGFLPYETLQEWFLAGEEMLWDRLYYTEYSKLASAVASSDRSLTAVERCCDNYRMEEIRSAKYVPYGAEVIIAFLLAHEYEVRNLRIVLAGKEAGIAPATLRERIRDSYV